MSFCSAAVSLEALDNAVDLVIVDVVVPLLFQLEEVPVVVAGTVIYAIVLQYGIVNLNKIIIHALK